MLGSKRRPCYEGLYSGWDRDGISGWPRPNNGRDPLWLVAVQLVDGLNGCLSHRAEVQHSWPLLVWCWGQLGVPWPTTAREKEEVWVWLHCDRCYSALKCVSRQEASHFPLVCPCVWSEDLESTRPSSQGWKASRKLSVFPWLSLLFLLSFSRFAVIFIGNPHSLWGLKCWGWG